VDRSWFILKRKQSRLSPVELLILLMLNKKPMHGYELVKTLREEFGEIWEPKTGTIYPALRRLEIRGFVRVEVENQREVYVLTDKGKEALKEAWKVLEAELEFAERYQRLIVPLSSRPASTVMRAISRTVKGLLQLSLAAASEKYVRRADRRLRSELLNALEELQATLESCLKAVNERINILKEREQEEYVSVKVEEEAGQQSSVRE